MSISRSDWEKTFQQIRARLAHTVPPVRYPVSVPSVIGVKAGLSLVALSPEPTAPKLITSQQCYDSSGSLITGTGIPKIDQSLTEKLIGTEGTHNFSNVAYNTVAAGNPIVTKAIILPSQGYIFVVGYGVGEEANIILTENAGASIGTKVIDTNVLEMYSIYYAAQKAAGTYTYRLVADGGNAYPDIARITIGSCIFGAP